MILLRILCDCDGVIFNPHILWAKIYQENGGGDYFRSLDDVKDWDFLKELLGDDFLDEYFTPEVVRDAPINSDMCVTIERLMDRHDVQFVTDVPDKRCQKVRKDRMMRLFGIYEHQITFVGIERVQMDADILIDDRLEVCNRFAIRGKISIVVSQPWNQCKKRLPGVYRAWGAHDLLNLVDVLEYDGRNNIE